jgi:multidrug efflux pump subunit AcrA (membrane-fusion protein)
VPVYVGLIDDFRQGVPVEVTRFGHDGGEAKFAASPVQAPPAADPLSSTADLYFRVANESQRLRPGERVAVSLPLNSSSEALVVPVNAILYDIHGGTWVYQKVGERRFRRARVFVERTTADFAILSRGLEVGTEVVVDGSAELFGTEFGTGK